MNRRYQWIVDRVEAGEVVAIDTTRRDMAAIIDFLAVLEPPSERWLIQSDGSHNLLWIFNENKRGQASDKTL